MTIEDAHLLNAQLADAVLADAAPSELEALLARGASPTMRPFRNKAERDANNQVADCALDCALLRGSAQAVELFLQHGALAESHENASRGLGLAALGGNVACLQLVVDSYSSHIDASWAFAYAVNQGFTAGAQYLYEHGALQDAAAWMGESAHYGTFKNTYNFMRGRYRYGMEKDFFAYFFDVPLLNAMVKARGMEPAGSERRWSTITELAGAGRLGKIVLRECAQRAFLFDLCEDYERFCELGGIEDAEVFGTPPASVTNYWVYPDMSPEKVELVARLMPPDYRFPLTFAFLPHLETLRAVIAHASAQSCACAPQLAECLVQNGLTEELAATADWGGIDAGNIDALIALANEHHRTQTAAFLVTYRKEHFAGSPVDDLLSGASML